MQYSRKHAGFTLIELLIVVAIIAILAAIAVPNFLEAQIRAKVSRVKSDFRTMSVALLSYFTDQNHFPVSWSQGHIYGTQGLDSSLYVLTTPVAYMTTTKWYDPFGQNIRIWLQNYGGYERGSRPCYQYFNYEHLRDNDWAYGWTSRFPDWSHKAFELTSPGPDVQDNLLWCLEFDVCGATTVMEWPFNATYDPSNGTVSIGDIGRVGGDSRSHDYPIDGK